MQNSVEDMKANLTNLCETYGWTFVDTTTLAAPGTSTPSASASLSPDCDGLNEKAAYPLYTRFWMDVRSIGDVFL